MIEFRNGMIDVPVVPASNRLNDTIPLATRSSRERVDPRTGVVIEKHFYWTVPVADAAAVVDWADNCGLEVDEAVRTYARDLWMRELDAVAMSSATSPDPSAPWSAPLGITTPLLETQKVVVAAASGCVVDHPSAPTRHRALLVADEPGLGKSVEALAVLRTPGCTARRTVIVCPNGLTGNWHAEITQHTAPGTFHPWTATGKKPKPIPGNVDTIIIGWSVLGDWVDTLTAWGVDAVVADEGHYAKSGKTKTTTGSTFALNPDGSFSKDAAGNKVVIAAETVVSGSQRATALLTLGGTVAQRNGLLLALTGTPIVNRPLELMPLLEFLGVLDLFGGELGFKNRYCGPKRVRRGGGSYATSYTGASNLLELNTRLAASGHYVRRTKEVLVDAGMLRRKYIDGVYCYDRTTKPNPWIIRASGVEMSDYLLAENDLAEFFAQRAREIAMGLRTVPENGRVQQRVAGEAYKHLQQIGVLRQLAAQVKMPYVIDKVRELVAQGERVVIAAHHRDVVKAYSDAFSGLRIIGEMRVAEVERVKALFNGSSIEEHPVLVLSVEAGKTGHTLCKQHLNGVGPSCRYMIAAEQIWTPGDEAQVEDRIWRIGQEREVRIVNALLAGSIDFQIFDQRMQKRRVVNAAVDAVFSDAMAVEKQSVGELAWSLAAKRLGITD